MLSGLSGLHLRCCTRQAQNSQCVRHLMRLESRRLSLRFLSKRRGTSSSDNLRFAWLWARCPHSSAFAGVLWPALALGVLPASIFVQPERSFSEPEHARLPNWVRRYLQQIRFTSPTQSQRTDLSRALLRFETLPLENLVARLKSYR